MSPNTTPNAPSVSPALPARCNSGRVPSKRPAGRRPPAPAAGAPPPPAAGSGKEGVRSVAIVLSNVQPVTGRIPRPGAGHPADPIAAGSTVGPAGEHRHQSLEAPADASIAAGCEPMHRQAVRQLWRPPGLARSRWTTPSLVTSWWSSGDQSSGRAAPPLEGRGASGWAYGATVLLLAACGRSGSFWRRPRRGRAGAVRLRRSGPQASDEPGNPDDGQAV